MLNVLINSSAEMVNKRKKNIGKNVPVDITVLNLVIAVLDVSLFKTQFKKSRCFFWEISDFLFLSICKWYLW